MDYMCSLPGLQKSPESGWWLQRTAAPWSHDLLEPNPTPPPVGTLLVGIANTHWQGLVLRRIISSPIWRYVLEGLT